MSGVAGILFRLQSDQFKGCACRDACVDEQYSITLLEVDGMFYLQLEVGEQVDGLEVFLQ